MTRFVRRRYWVGRSQRRLLVFNLGYYVVFLGVFSAALWAPLILGMYDDGLRDSQREQMAALLLYLHTRLVPVAVLLMGLFALHSILVSHRIAGPLVRFSRTFERIGEGDLAVRIRLRDRDYLHEEADELNAMLDALGERLRRVEGRHAEVRAEWQRLAEDLGEEHLAQVRSVFEHMAAYEREWGALALGTPPDGSPPTAPAAALPSGTRTDGGDDRPETVPTSASPRPVTDRRA